VTDRQLGPKTAEKPVCRRWRGWTAVYIQQVDRSKTTGFSPGWHVSDTGELWRQIRWCTAVQSSVGRYGDFEQDALLNAKPVDADERVSDVLGVPYPKNKPCCRISSLDYHTKC